MTETDITKITDNYPQAVFVISNRHNSYITDVRVVQDHHQRVAVSVFCERLRINNDGTVFRAGITSMELLRHISSCVATTPDQLTQTTN